jgi:hypothetical protein
MKEKRGVMPMLLGEGNPLDQISARDWRDV